MLTEPERKAYYESLNLTQQQISLIDRTISESPARKVGKGAIKNSTIAFHSRINGGTRRDLESQTVEGLHALELELSNDVHEYFTQVPIYGVERWIEGRRYVNPAKLDMLVFTSTRIKFVECKDLDTVKKSYAQHPYDWKEANGTWTHVAYDAWARDHGFDFELWTSPSIPGISLANHLLLYDLKYEPLISSEKRFARQLIRRIRNGPLSISNVVAAVDGVNARVISILLANRQIYGTIQSVALNNFENFVLCSDETRAAEIDASLLTRLERSFKQPENTDPVLCASTTDYQKGKQRLSKVEQMRSGAMPVTRRYRSLVRAVDRAHLDGTSCLAPCLTAYANCGSTDPKLDPDQRKLMEDVFKEYWDTGVRKFVGDLHSTLENVGEQRGISTPCQSTMSHYLNLRSKSPHLLNTGGRKSLHASEDPTDPAKSSIPALAPGLFMHVDATKFDHRSSPISPEIISALPFACPTLYVAVDSCTNRPIGRALFFGAQCRDGLAILIRDILARRFRLPRYIFADGGSEYIGEWFDDFCLATGMSRLKPPTGDPAKNSPAENVLGRVNLFLSQRLIGSTEPDKAGRRVDNRFKSYHTACLLFKGIVAEVEEVLFGDIATTPTSNNVGSPEEKTEFLREAFGPVGIARTYDDEFRILTSPIITCDISAVGTSGYKHEERMYRSPRLSELLVSGLADQKRRDCVDPSLMYFKFESEWVKAHSRDSVELRGYSETELLFRSLNGREIRSTNRCIRKEKSRARLDRIDRANASSPATSHLPPSDTPDPLKSTDTKPFTTKDMDEITPFPEDEQNEEAQAKC